MRARLLHATRDFFRPTNVATNFVWYLISLAVPSLISSVGGALLHLSTPEKVIVGVALILLFLAGGIVWREQHLPEDDMASKRKKKHLNVPRQMSLPSATPSPSQSGAPLARPASTGIKLTNSPGSTVRRNITVDEDIGIDVAHSP